MQINGNDLVPGDLVDLMPGKNIPADVIILNQTDMKVSNASLTGESEELARHSDPSKAHENIFETGNAAFFGTQCTQGKGVGLVFRIGDDTIIGQIANLASSAESKETPLSLEIAIFIRFVSGVAIFLGVLFFFIGVGFGYDFITNLVFAIGIIVANVPEGLLATVTVSLAFTAKRMAGKKVLVKNLESIETLGSTSCICSDKTGTLTQNRMTVSHSYINGKRVDLSTNYEIFFNNEKLEKKNN
jgi:sodium/potassium-transporting ATPase subunit alpha